MSHNFRESRVPEDATRGEWLPGWTQRIENVQRMQPFFMSVASPSNHWLFVSSLGSLTAGRTSAEHALFPYRTVDRVHDAVGRVGGKTIVRLGDGTVWEPFCERSAPRGDVTRSLDRSAYGTSITLIERAGDLGLEARQTWTSSEAHGVLRFFELRNLAATPVAAQVLDGVIDVLPASVDVGMQQTLSTLVDAYRSTELVETVAVFGMGSIPVDRAEPSEALLANTAWCTASGTVLLSERQLEGFRQRGAAEPERLARGVRGALMVAQPVTLAAGASAKWAFALEVDQAGGDVEATLAWLRDAADPLSELDEAARATESDLAAILAEADALQRTGSDAEDARHYANTLYNVMRGGVPIAPRTPAPTGDDPDVRRHALEGLPLAFSRRHGDPSRPWNRFSIDVKNEDGSWRPGHEGNWRDIFQNWEALGIAYPEFLLTFIVRFLNASTADGYNPYRITDQGVDWEVNDPDDPWSYIGYWGDHQIGYLSRLIERHLERFPGELESLFDDPIFVHVDVPYRIRGFDDLVRDPSSTVDYDDERAALLESRTADHGADGKLLRDAAGQLVRATLEEKLLVPILTKLSNLVPGAGIWMNTQRPEWNDANNALAAGGASIVTSAALLRHVEVVARLLGDRAIRCTERTAELIDAVGAALDAFEPRGACVDEAERWRFAKRLGAAGERHRTAVYAGEELAVTRVAKSRAATLLARAREHLAATLDASRRDDGLFHTYNLLAFRPGEAVGMHRLPLMLEGQVAVLSAGAVSADEAVALLAALRQSPLHRADQHSYLLYPDRLLTPFVERGRIPTEAAERVPLLAELVAAGDRAVVRGSTTGDSTSLHFAPELRNRYVLSDALDRLASGPHAASAARDRAALLALYEDVFVHAAFTGRSGTFFGYEGLGSIYWHMVSKLVLAVQETFLRAHDAGVAPGTLDGLREHYQDVRAGLGTHKSPEVYGAFPSEPYSHTPANAGARQPGMTGQVKEDLLTRPAELGLRAVDGCLHFDDALLDPHAFCDAPAVLPRPNAPEVRMDAGTCSLTHCGVPVTVRRGDAPSVTVTLADGTERAAPDPKALDPETSRALWMRDGSLARIDVEFRA